MSSVKFSEVTVVLGDPSLPDRSKPELRFTAEDLDNFARMKKALGELPGYSFSFHENHRRLIDDLRHRPPAFALNFCDSGYRNDARLELHVAALLEMLDIPYSGSGPVALGLCYDKALVRALAASQSIPVPRQRFCKNDLERPPEGIVYPAFIKPNSADGSVGITTQSLVRNAAEAGAYLDKLRSDLPGQAVLIQEFLSGAEYSIALIGNPGNFTALPVLTVDYSGLDPSLPQILDYGSKIDPQSPYWTDVKYRQAELDPATVDDLVGYAETLFERLGLRDYARFDFRSDARGEPKLLEVNPNPAWSWDAKLNLMAGFHGLNYAELLELILYTAQMRY